MTNVIDVQQAVNLSYIIDGYRSRICIIVGCIGNLYVMSVYLAVIVSQVRNEFARLLNIK